MMGERRLQGSIQKYLLSLGKERRNHFSARIMCIARTGKKMNLTSSILNTWPVTLHSYSVQINPISPPQPHKGFLVFFSFNCQHLGRKTESSPNPGNNKKAIANRLLSIQRVKSKYRTGIYSRERCTWAVLFPTQSTSVIKKQRIWWLSRALGK